jgi:hypothetical protein
MSNVRHLHYALTAALFCFLVCALGGESAVAADATQEASLSAVNPSTQDYAAKPGPSAGVTPTDPLKLAVFKVFETHCSRCHETERLVGRTKPAKGFGNILHLDEVAANKRYVTPGDVDHSSLYWQVKRGDMPNDLTDGDPKLATSPSDADLKTLRDWIVDLGQKKQQEVASLAPVFSPRLPVKPVVDLPPASETADYVARSPHTADPVAVLVPQPASVSENQKEKMREASEPAQPVIVARLDPGQAQTLSTTPPGAETDVKARVSLPTGQELVFKTQAQLKKLGCYEGEINGVEDTRTADALARYNQKQGRGTAVASLTSDLLEELLGQIGRICSPPCPPNESFDGLQCVPERSAAPPGHRQSSDRINEEHAHPASHQHHPNSGAPSVAKREEGPKPKHEQQVQRPPASHKVAHYNQNSERPGRRQSPQSSPAPRATASMGGVTGLNGL